MDVDSRKSREGVIIGQIQVIAGAIEGITQAKGAAKDPRRLLAPVAVIAVKICQNIEVVRVGGVETDLINIVARGFQQKADWRGTQFGASIMVVTPAADHHKAKLGLFDQRFAPGKIQPGRFPGQNIREGEKTQPGTLQTVQVEPFQQPVNLLRIQIALQRELVLLVVSLIFFNVFLFDELPEPEGQQFVRFPGADTFQQRREVFFQFAQMPGEPAKDIPRPAHLA